MLFNTSDGNQSIGNSNTQIRYHEDGDEVKVGYHSNEETDMDNHALFMRKFAIMDQSHELSKEVTLNQGQIKLSTTHGSEFHNRELSENY